VLHGLDTELRAGLGDKDLVAGKVAGGSVVAAVRDTPRVVGDEEERVKDPADRVVDGLGGRVGLVAGLVGDNPDTGADKTSREDVSRPEGELGGSKGDRREGTAITSAQDRQMAPKMGVEGAYLPPQVWICDAIINRITTNGHTKAEGIRLS
jgi:hypothetical protein